ncbi:hypothetical protein PybrP1_012452 [[Pythium] brassicae (nom. inval.)]|nr:hypothetical protein PybrP1_012452 [[Pythium] brassicae (nom. inval.)]
MTGGRAACAADVDFFSLHNRKHKPIDVEMLDYAYVEKCADLDELKGILAVLRSGKEGRYPHLEKTTEDRLLALLPERERQRIVRMRAEPSQQELAAANDELLAWSADMDATHTALQERSAGGGHRLPPVRGQTPVDSAEAPTPRAVAQMPEAAPPKRAIPAYDFRAWETYDVDQALEDIDAQDAQRQEQARRQRAAHEQREAARKKELAALPPGVALDALSREVRAVHALREKYKGNECFKANETDEAVLYYTRSLAFDDANAVVYANRAAAYLRAKSFAAAEQDCARAILLDPAYAKGWSRRGMARFRRGKYAEAAADFAAALRLEPGSRELEKLLTKAQDKRREVDGDGSACSSSRRPQQAEAEAEAEDNPTAPAADAKPFRRFEIVEDSDPESDEDDDPPPSQVQLRTGDDDDVAMPFQRFEIIED